MLVFYSVILQKELMVRNVTSWIPNRKYTSRKTVFYDNFVSFWMCHSKHSCHIEPFSYHIGHFLPFWTVTQKTMFSTSDRTSKERF